MRHPAASAIARVLAVVPLIIAVMAMTGCGGRAPAGSSAPQPAAGSRPESTATLAIVAPAPGEHVAGSTLHVRIRLTGATVVPQTSTDLKPDKGHIHLSLDGRVVSMSYGVEQDVPVTAGAHLLTAEFVATDHFPFNPRVLKTVTFEVQ